MHTIRRTTALAATLLFAALLAGCGGEVSKADYEADVKRVGEQIEEEQAKLSEGTPTADDLSSVGASLQSAADDLDEIEAPGEVEQLHDDLVAWMQDSAALADDAAPLMTALSDSPENPSQEDRDKLAELQEDFSSSEGELTRITKGFEDKQYEIGLGK